MRSYIPFSSGNGLPDQIAKHCEGVSGRMRRVAHAIRDVAHDACSVGVTEAAAVLATLLSFASIDHKDGISSAIHQVRESVLDVANETDFTPMIGWQARHAGLEQTPSFSPIERDADGDVMGER